MHMDTSGSTCHPGEPDLQGDVVERFQPLDGPSRARRRAPAQDFCQDSATDLQPAPATDCF